MQAAAFLGGPLPVGILLFKNFKRLRRDAAAYISLASASIILVLVFMSLMQEGGILSRAPRLAIPILYSLITFFVYKTYLFKDVAKAMSEGAKTASNWVVVGYTALGLAFSAAVLFGFTLFISEFDGPYTDFGSNRLYHDESMSDAVLRSTADQLYAMEHFDQLGFEASIKQYEAHYEITMLYLSENWEDEEFINFFKEQRLAFQSFLDKEVVIVLRDYDRNGNMIIRQIRE